MRNRIRVLLVVVVLALVLGRPAPAVADGGPYVQATAWTYLHEVEQVAVVHLDSSQVAHVDLFVSLRDESPETHEVVFFLPLGHNPSDFAVVEENSRAFAQALTNPLDQTITNENARSRSYKQGVLFSLLGGMMVINGGWTWPLWTVLGLAGCGAGPPAPVATYETENSSIEIYQIDPDTDLQQLTSATGLAPDVQETLARLQGQQIAIITLRTQPPTTFVLGDGAGEPGIHMAWSTDMVPGASGPTYDYPLGTGQSWARPIEKTRVYVVAPPGIDFTVDYPRLGSEDQSYDPVSWLIRPVYRVDDVVGEWGRIWRIVYTASNASTDIRITWQAGLSAHTQAALRLRQWQQPIGFWTLPVSLLLALACWVVAWRYLMPRILGTPYRWRNWRLWRDAIGWALVYPLSNAAALSVVALPVVLVWALSGRLGELVADWRRLTGFTCLAGCLWIPVACVVLLVSSIGLISGYLFARVQSRASGVSRERALSAYAAVVAVTNVVYTALALTYAALVGAL